LFKTAYHKSDKAQILPIKSAERETPFSFRLEGRTSIRSYHRTGAESYYGRNTKCKKFYKFFTRSVRRIFFSRPLMANLPQGLTASRPEYETLGRSHGDEGESADGFSKPGVELLGKEPRDDWYWLYAP
jgi:hypothetical protein